MDPAPARYVLTGPSGWIGSALLAELAARGGSGWAGRVTAFGSAAYPLTAPDETMVPVRPLETITPADVADAHVFHLAYLTKEKADLLGEPAFTAANRAIDDLMLGALAAGGARSVFVASSGAAMLAADGRDPHPYGLAKLQQEARFLAWGAASATPMLAGRIFNLSGPFINKIDSYAIGSMIRQAPSGRIEIAATVPVYRSFLHVTDLCRLILAAADARLGLPAPVDLCGAELVEMAGLAERIAGHSGDPRPAIGRGPVDWTRPSVYAGDAAQTLALAGRLGVPLRRLDPQIVETIEWLTGQTENTG